MIDMYSDELIYLRHTYRSCMLLADQTDSKREDKQYRKEASEALSKLQLSCPHNHVVVTQHGYEGSYSMDYDDRRAEHRLCIFCGKTEYNSYITLSYNHNDSNNFKVLHNPIAELRGSSQTSLINEFKNPLMFLLSELDEIIERICYKL